MTTQTPSAKSTIYYHYKREPLADIIQAELLEGEEVYILTNKGTFIPSNAPSLNMDTEDVGANSDDRGDYISARVPTEEDCLAVENIATKYGREFVSGYDRWVIGNKYFVKIYLQPEDWDKPYFDPNVQIRPDGRRREYKNK